MENKQVLDLYFDAMNAERWDDFARVWGGGSLVQAVGAKPRHGVSEIVEFYKGLFTPWRVHVDTPTRTIGIGDTVAVEVTFTGTSRSGVSITFDAVDVIDFSDGVIAKLTNWYDLTYVRRLLAAGTP
jgi:ketosteroid isomerase-like protein